MLTTQQPNYYLPPVGRFQVSRKPLWVGGSESNLSSLEPLYPVLFSLVVPTYNEGSNIHALVQRLSALLNEALPNAYELIIVDDDSPDRNWEQAESLCRETHGDRRCHPLELLDQPQIKLVRDSGEIDLTRFHI